MDFKHKYLKYKAKYVELKSQVGLGIKRYRYKAVVPEFANKTKDEFKSERPRHLNTVEIFDKFDGVDNLSDLRNKIILNKDGLCVTGAEIDEFMALLEAGSDKIILMEGFFNKFINYADNTKKGTFVKKEDFAKVFKDEIPSKIKEIGNDEIEGFFGTDGAGKKNLNKAMKEYAALGAKYVFLEAAGSKDLVSLYKHYGFTIILDGFNFLNIYEEPPVRALNPHKIMFANIANVIAKTN
jgi:hypothetical protein